MKVRREGDGDGGEFILQNLRNGAPGLHAGGESQGMSFVMAQKLQMDANPASGRNKGGDG